jgi:transposase InsO family protein
MKTSSNKTALARKLGVCRQSLYYAKKKPKKDEEIKTRILTVQEEHPAYGHKRIALHLKLNRKRILRVMKLFHLKPRLMRGKPWKPNDIGKPATGIRNLAETICPVAPNALWAGDFTYIPWEGKFVYVATVLDVFTREIIGWHIGLHHTSDLVMRALLDAVERTGLTPHIFHSDQGSEYVSEAYETLLSNLNIRASQSKKSSPWENGYQESFYNNFKLELGNPKQLQNLGALSEAVYRQIRYYNNKRIHTSLKMPPVIFHNVYKNKTTTMAVV